LGVIFSLRIAHWVFFFFFFRIDRGFKSSILQTTGFSPLESLLSHPGQDKGKARINQHLFQN
jgi:hypothetical protein